MCYCRICSVSVEERKGEGGPQVIESLNHQQSLQSLVHLGVRSELELEDSCGGWDATCD